MTLDPPEPDITINGVRLTEAQAMTVRVAVQVFAVTLEPFRDDVRQHYLDRIAEINQQMMRKERTRE